MVTFRLRPQLIIKKESHLLYVLNSSENCRNWFYDYKAICGSGNPFIKRGGNFNAKILHPLKKVELDTIVSKVFELGNVEETIDQFQRGEIAFYKNSHPFEIFLRLHAKNQRS